MIDTVVFRQEHIARSTANLRQGWQTIQGTPIRVFYSDNRIKEIQASLPNVLFGVNSKLLSSQQQIDDALKAVESILLQLARPSKFPRDFIRVDLVWQFQFPPVDFFLAHQHCNHPSIRKRMAMYRNKHRLTGLRWEGTQMTINFYDKTQRKVRLSRQVVRAEVQLHGDKVRRALAGGKSVRSLNLRTCYSAYRKIMLQFRPKPTPQISSKDEAIFYAETQGVLLFNKVIEGMSPQNIRRLREKATAFALNYYQIEWEKLLPKDRMPKPVAAGPLKPIKIRLI